MLALSSELDENWRGDYDLLVTSSRDSLNRCFDGVSSRVAANFASGGEGGLTMRDVESMRSVPDVEVAAPIGLVGEYTGNSMYASLLIPDDRPPGEESWDGYQVTSELTMDTGAEVVDLASAQTRAMMGGSEGGLISDYGGGSPGEFYLFAVVGVPPLTQSIVAVDPEAEMQLLGSDGSFLRPLRGVADVSRDMGRADFGGDIDSMTPPVGALRGSEPQVPQPPGSEQPGQTSSEEEGGERVQAIPVVVNTDPQFRLLLDLTVHELDTSQIPEDLPLQSADLLLPDAPLGPALPGHRAVFSDTLRPFSNAMLTVPAWWTETKLQGIPGPGTTTSVGRGVPSPLNLEDDECRMTALPEGPVAVVGEALGTTIQRGVHQQTYRGTQSVDVDTPLPVPTVIGEYSSSLVDAGVDRVSYVPLGAYEPGQTLISEPIRSSVSAGETLRPALHGRGVAMASAAGITDMRGARDLIGRDAVDAVRVRVGGLSGYDEAGRARVAEVAGALQEMGYHVDVVAGSSREATQIIVPGYYVTEDRQNPEALGTVTQQWSTLGAAARVESSMDRVGQVLLVIAVGAASMMTIALAGFAGVARRTEVAVQQTVGWTKAESTRFLGGELAVGFAVLGVAGAVAFLLFDDGPALRGTAAAAASAYLIGGALLLVQAQPPRHGAARRNRTARKAAPSFGVIGFAVRRLGHDRLTHGLLALAAAGAGTAAGGCALAILRARAEAGETMLNVLLRDTLLPLHLALGAVGLVSCVVLAVVSRRVQLAATRPAERALVTVGWGRRDLQRMWTVQALVVGLVAVVLSVGGGVLVAQRAAAPTLVLITSVCATGLVVIASWAGQRRAWRSMT